MAAVRPRARERKPVQQGAGQPRGGAPAICGRPRGGAPAICGRAREGPCFCNGGGPPASARAHAGSTWPMRSAVVTWRTICQAVLCAGGQLRAAAACLPAVSRGHGDESHIGPALPHGPRPARAAPLPGHAVMNRTPQEASTVASRVESMTGQCPTLSPPQGAAAQAARPARAYGRQ
ncbi:MAG: hypothetical protein J3K34DRAFT_230481 [Monoraphidium minutum]|nr:MAG: hypothetical protein J3K34DRAFT_230481 [Monoraphidium minutum]